MIHKLTMLDIDKFMEEFVKPVAGEPDDSFFDNLFDSVPTGGQESDMYEAFVSISVKTILVSLTCFLFGFTHVLS